MANDIERMLELNNRIEKGNVTPKQNSGTKRAMSQHDVDRIIEDYDRQVYGPVSETKDAEEYSAEKEMKRLQEIEAQGGRTSVSLEGRNIPRNIVESILNNPLDLPPHVDSKMMALEQRLSEGMPGIKSAKNILEKVEKQDEERIKLTEQLKPRETTANVDYELIKTIVEEAVNSKINVIKESLNESKTQGYVPSMKYLSFKDKFYFIDNDDNVFECVMKYKGKRKK